MRFKLRLRIASGDIRRAIRGGTVLKGILRLLKK